MNWSTVNLEKIAEIQSGIGFPVEYQGLPAGDIPFAKVGDISKAKRLNGDSIASADNFINIDTLKNLKAKPFPENSIVFAKIGEAIRKNNRVITTKKMLFDNNVMGIIPNKEFVWNKYLYHFLETVDFYSLSNSTTVPSIRKTDMARLQIPLPPLEEQKRIAAILDQADALRRLRQRSIDRLNSLGQAIFYEMFVQNKEESWPTLTVSDLVDPEKGGIRTGPFGSQLLHCEFVDEGIAVLGIDNAVTNEFSWEQRRYITPEKYSGLSRYRVNPGDVIITIMGTCGRCAVVPEGIPLAINTKHLCCISLRADLCLPDYLHAFFLHHPSAQKYLQSKSKGAIMDGLNMGIIKSMPITLPPIKLQNQFSARLNKLKHQKTNTIEHTTNLEILFFSLQHRAFNGELSE